MSVVPVARHGDSRAWRLPYYAGACAAACLLGVIAALEPERTLMGLGVGVGVAILVLVLCQSDIYFGVVSFTLITGYAAFNRAFAGLHITVMGIPLYVGEIGLAILIGPALWRLRRWRPQAPMLALWVWMGFSAILTITQLTTYRTDAIRDAATWYYGLYALIGLAVWKSLNRVVIRRWMLLVVVLGLLPTFTFMGLFGEAGSHIQPAFLDVPIAYVAPDTAGAQALMGVLFVLAGLHTGSARWLGPVVWLLVPLGAAAVLALQARALGVAGAAAIAVLLGFRVWRSVVLFALLATVLLVVTSVLNIGVGRRLSTGLGETLSASSLLERQFSTVAFVSGSDVSRFDAGTIAWRLTWWRALLAETEDDLGMLLIGRGYGPDLRQVVKKYAGPFSIYDQGVDVGRPVRSPHSIVMTLLARSGLIGLGLWLLMLFLSATWIAVAVRKYRRHGDEFTARFGVWIAAQLVVILGIALFGVVLEGPVAGIPFFWLLGLAFGWAEGAPPGQPDPLTSPGHS
jgi:hypothetical protein